MTQPADFIVANDSGQNVRTDINQIFDAIGKNQIPSDSNNILQYMWHADTSAGKQKMSFYKDNATDKIEFISLEDGSFFGPPGSKDNPSYTFSDSTNTGFFRPAANEIGTSCNAVTVATFKETGVDIAGDLTIQHPAGENSDVTISAPGTSDNAILDLKADNNQDFGLRLIRNTGQNGKSQILHKGTESLELNTDEAAPIVLTTNSTERARLDATGVFMVGQTSLYDSTVYGTTGSGVIQCGGLNANRPGISCIQNSASSTVAIGFHTTAAGPVGSISTAGSATSFNAAPSDRTLKENFEDWNEEVLTLFKNINPQKFNFISDTAGTEKTKGFIAQDMVSSFPEAYPKLSGKYMFNPSGMVTYLMKGLQEAVAKIETLEAKVAVLEGS